MKDMNDWPQLTSLMVYQHGASVDARYFRVTTESDLVPLRSMTKCMTTTLVGLAIAEGFVSGVEQEVSAFFTELESGLTVHHLLSMTSGFEVDDSQLYEWAKTELNWLEAIFRIPVRPEKTFRYKGTDTHLLSCLLTRILEKARSSMRSVACLNCSASKNGAGQPIRKGIRSVLRDWNYAR